MDLIKRKLLNKNTLMTILFAVLFLVFPFWSGLYFKVPTAYSVVFAALVTFVVSLIALIRKTEVKGFTRIDLFVAIYTLIVLCSIFTYAHLELTVVGILKQFAFLFIYLLVRLLVAQACHIRPLFSVVAVSGAVFSVYGLLVAFNILSHDGAMFYGDGDNRIASVFEYPNTYASFLAVSLLFGLSLQTGFSKWLPRAVWLFVNTLTLLGLILSYSRGGWGIFALALLLMILLAPKGKRSLIVVDSLSAFIVTAAGLPILSSAFLAGARGKGALGILVLLIASTVLSFLIERLHPKLSKLSIKTRIVLPVLIVVVLGGSFAAYQLGMLPESVKERITSINFELLSVQQRLVFYKDGFSALTDHPFFGAGDHAWEATFYKYQSYPYYTTAPHSMLVDQIMNTGSLGTLLFVTIIFCTIRFLWKLRRQAELTNGVLYAGLLAAFLEIVSHGLIDVDFNYAVVGYLFWILVAMSALGAPLAHGSMNSLNAWNWNPANRWVWWSMSISSLAVVLFAGSYVYAAHQVELAKSTLGTPAVALDHLEQAQGVAPYIMDIGDLSFSLTERYYERSNDPIILQNMQDGLLKQPHLSPNNSDLLMRTGQQLINHRRPLEGIALVKRAWENGPYRAEVAEQYMILNGQVGEALQKTDKERAKSYFQEALHTYQLVQQRIEGLNELPSVLRPERPYAITPNMNEFAAAAALYTGRYAEAEHYATAGLQGSKDPAKLSAVIVLAQQKQGKPVDGKLMGEVARNKQAQAVFSEMKQQL